MLKKIGIVIICIFMCTLSTSCAVVELGYHFKEKKYYSDESNFVTVEAICNKLYVNEHFPGQYFIEVEEIVCEETEESFISFSFEVNKKNSTILKEANVEEKLIHGTMFTFISAPRYFGDGYMCPIVALEIDGEVLLDFETGYKNLMATY